MTEDESSGGARLQVAMAEGGSYGLSLVYGHFYQRVKALLLAAADARVQR